MLRSATTTTAIVSLLLFAQILIVCGASEVRAIDAQSNGSADPCAYTRCGFGAICRNLPNGRAKCDCPNLCPRIPTKPICANDGKTYASVCYMNVQACIQSKNLTFAHEGECESQTTRSSGQQNETNDCSNIKCHYGSVCSIDGNGRAFCECPTICPQIYQPVCASDGKTYSNKCSMNVEACKEQRKLVVVHDGKCDDDLCARTTCSYGSKCRVNPETQQAICECPKYCTKIFQPVCGSNGKTYSNECLLNVEACEQNNAVEVVHNGQCEEEGTETAEAGEAEGVKGKSFEDNREDDDCWLVPRYQRIVFNKSDQS